MLVSDVSKWTFVHPELRKKRAAGDMATYADLGRMRALKGSGAEDALALLREIRGERAGEQTEEPRQPRARRPGAASS